jgi:methylated-DNA-[protein]-cysteine S-methyltransferase
VNCLQFDTPLGTMLAASHEDAVTGLWFLGQRHFPLYTEAWPHQRNTLLDSVEAQVLAYFSGERTQFDLPLAPQGTSFQRAVWQQLRAIPHGQSSSYGEVAQALGQPAAARAVGAAVGRNPWSIIVPCHRVVGSSGALTGYAGGISRKQQLLALEADGLFAANP